MDTVPSVGLLFDRRPQASERVEYILRTVLYEAHKQEVVRRLGIPDPKDQRSFTKPLVDLESAGRLVTACPGTSCRSSAWFL